MRLRDIIHLEPTRIEGMYVRTGSFEDLQAMDERYRELEEAGGDDVLYEKALYRLRNFIYTENGERFEDINTVDDVKAIDMNILMEALSAGGIKPLVKGEED